MEPSEHAINFEKYSSLNAHLDTTMHLLKNSSENGFHHRNGRPRRWSVTIPDSFERLGKGEEYATVWFEQIWILSKRTLLHNLRNPYLLRAQCTYFFHIKSSSYHIWIVLFVRLRIIKSRFLRILDILTVCLGVLLGLIFYQLQNNLQGVQDKAGALFFIAALFAFGSLSSIDVCKY